MLMNTVDLTDARLHYAVARVLGAELRPNSIGAQHAYLNEQYIGGFVTRNTNGVSMPHHVFAPTRNSSHGSVIGERLLEDQIESLQRTPDGWYAVAKGNKKAIAHGATMRVAGLRAVVCSQLGATIDIPDWLD